MNRKKIFNILVFKELIKQIGCIFKAKETVGALLVTNHRC